MFALSPCDGPPVMNTPINSGQEFGISPRQSTCWTSVYSVRALTVVFASDSLLQTVADRCVP